MSLNLPRLQALCERRHLRHRQAPTVHLIAQFRRRNLDGKSLLQHLTIPLRFPHVVGGGRGGTLSSLRRHLFRLGNNIFLGRRRRRRRIRLSGRRAGRVFKSHTLDRLSSRRPRSVRRGLNGRIVRRSDVLKCTLLARDCRRPPKIIQRLCLSGGA